MVTTLLTTSTMQLVSSVLLVLAMLITLSGMLMPMRLSLCSMIRIKFVRTWTSAQLLLLPLLWIIQSILTYTLSSLLMSLCSIIWQLLWRRRIKSLRAQLPKRSPRKRQQLRGSTLKWRRGTERPPSRLQCSERWK